MTIKYLSFVSLLLITLFFFSPISSANPQSVEIYVSPEGNDAWSGLVASPNDSSTDGPVQTLERARDIVRNFKKIPNVGQTAIKVFLRGGTYFRSQSFVLGESDSGTQDAPIIWQNYKDEHVQIIGGVEVSGFSTITDKTVLSKLSKQARMNTLQLDLKSLGISDYGKITRRGNPGLELFFNDQRMTIARWPNEGWVKIADVPQTGKLVHKGNSNILRDGVPAGRHYGRFSFAEDRPLKWTNTKNIVVHGYWTWDWYDEFFPVKSIDRETREIYVDTGRSAYGLRKNQRYYALNILEELDRPGEWYLDRKVGILYFWPPQAISKSKAYVSLFSKPLFILNNTHNISVTGLTFEFSRGSAIEINGGSNNHIVGCTIRNIARTAVRINGGKNNGITSCDIFDISSSGISLVGGERTSLTPAHNYAVNNHIYNYSSWIRTYQPAIQIKGVGNRVAHNQIHDGPHSGIVLNGNEHIIEYNDIYQVAKETGDVGAFYIGRDWTQRGNIIRHNFFHHLGSPEIDDVNAIYLDDFSSGTNIYGNVIYDVGLGIKIGGGRNNLVRDNVFIDTKRSINVDSRGLGWAKNFINGTNNTLHQRMDAMNYSQPPYSEKYPELIKLYDDDPAIAKGNRIFNNISSGGVWLRLIDGLDFKTVNVHDNVVFQRDGKYQNPRDVLLPNEDFIKVVEGQLNVEDNIQHQYDIKIPDIKKMGNFKDGYRN
ncbi:right-handed parallel beta-helix repeat-containing protein [Vibrio sp. WJH972]